MVHRRKGERELTSFARLARIAFQIVGLFHLPFLAATAHSATIVVSIPEQRLYVFDDEGNKTAGYPVSTSAHGLGDGRGTYSTPLGKLQIAAKIGDGAEIGTVFKAGRRTGEICKVNARGRDPIITRILHLRGLERQNAGAYARCIYIHGTPDERRIGKPVSYGCIRMRSRDVIELFDAVSIGTSVEIVDSPVSKGLFAKTTWNARPEPIATGPTRDHSASSPVPSSNVAKPVPQKIVVATAARTADSPARAAAKERPSASEPMTLFEMPGMAFKFGPSSRDEVR